MLCYPNSRIRETDIKLSRPMILLVLISHRESSVPPMSITNKTAIAALGWSNRLPKCPSTSSDPLQEEILEIPLFLDLDTAVVPHSCNHLTCWSSTWQTVGLFVTGPTSHRTRNAPLPDSANAWATFMSLRPRAFHLFIIYGSDLVWQIKKNGEIIPWMRSPLYSHSFFY
jgi:hypothetical protein